MSALGKSSSRFSPLTSYLFGTTVEATVECMAIFNFAKNTFAFACPFFLPNWAFAGFKNAYVVQAVLSTVLGLLLCVFLLLGGRWLHEKTHVPRSQ